MNGDVSHKGGETDVELPSDLIICRACAKPLTSPRLLPCYHTVCSPCLNSHIATQVSDEGGNQTFPCPICQKSTTLPPEDENLDHQNYADRFEPDYFTEKLSNVLSTFKDDKKCDLCQRRRSEELATDWCMECVDAMCQGCLKVHLCGKTTSDHTVVSLSELRKLSLANVLRRGTSQLCKTHTTETVRFYCLDCLGPACVQCLALNHRKCEKCLPVTDAMTALDDAVADVMVRLRSATDTSRSSHETNGSDVISTPSNAQLFDDSIQEAEEKIRSVAENLRQLITDRETELLERLDSAAASLQEKVGNFHGTPRSRDIDVKTLSSARDRLEALMKYGSDVEVLDLFQEVQAPLARVEGSGPAGSNDEVQMSVKLSLDESVQNFLRDFQKLGEVHVQDSSSDEGMSSWGVAVTESNDILVVDCRNRRIQKFGLSGDLLDHIQVSVEPRDITSCGRAQNTNYKKEQEEEFAVTMMGKQVYIITVADKMALKRRFKTSKQYDGIVYSSLTLATSGMTKASPTGFFLVSSLEDRCIDVINPEGDVLKTFGGTDPVTGVALFSSPRYVALTKEGHFVVSDSGQNCVISLNQEGGAQFKYAPDGSHEIASPQGICGDKFGNVFLADYGNSRVHLITSDGELDRFVLGPDSGLRRPVATALTPRDNKLVIVQSDGVVKVFSYGDTKVKMKVPCWCPRCSTSTDDGEDESPRQSQSAVINELKQGLKTRTRSGAYSNGSGSSVSSRSGSESCGPFSPTSPVFPSPANSGFKRY